MSSLFDDMYKDLISKKEFEKLNKNSNYYKKNYKIAKIDSKESIQAHIAGDYDFDFSDISDGEVTTECPLYEDISENFEGTFATDSTNPVVDTQNLGRLLIEVQEREAEAMREQRALAKQKKELEQREFELRQREQAVAEKEKDKKSRDGFVFASGGRKIDE
jgi:hypothetical protein